MADITIGSLPASDNTWPNKKLPLEDQTSITPQQVIDEAVLEATATIPTQQPSDWNATSGVTAISNKPTLGSAAAANTTDFATPAQVATKQDNLVSGTNIKTVGGASILGSGDIPFPAQQQADWAASTGVTAIANKPTDLVTDIDLQTALEDESFIFEDIDENDTNQVTSTISTGGNTIPVFHWKGIVDAILKTFAGYGVNKKLVTDGTGVISWIDDTSGGGGITQLDDVTGFDGTAGTTAIDLTWGAVVDATSYEVERDTVNTFTSPVNIYTGGALSFSDSGLTESTTYYYRIRAKAAGYTDSDWVVITEATTTAADPNLMPGFSYINSLPDTTYGPDPVTSPTNNGTYAIAGTMQAVYTGYNLNAIGAELIWDMSDTVPSTTYITGDDEPSIATIGADFRLAIEYGNVQFYNSETYSFLSTEPYILGDFIGYHKASATTLEIIRYRGGIRSVIYSVTYSSPMVEIMVKINELSSTNILYLQQKGCTYIPS